MHTRFPLTAAQIAGSSLILISAVLSPDGPVEPAVVLYLGYLILTVTGAVVRQRTAALLFVFLKCAYCVVVSGFSDAAILLIPAAAAEIPLVAASQRFEIRFWIACGIGLVGAALLIPQELLAAWAAAAAFSVFVGIDAGRKQTARSLQRNRILVLEKSRADAERRLAELEKAGAAQELLAKYEERERIAQEFHDELGHAVTGSIMQLDAAQLIFDDEPGRAREIVGRVSVTLKAGLDAIRTSLRTIKPAPALIGRQKIQAMLDDFSSDHAIGTSFSVEGDDREVPPRIWEAVEANLREALTNVLRHSDARSFSCTIGVFNRVFKVEFRDDGTAVKAPRHGMGLDGIEARTRGAGGTLIVDSAKGFSLIMLFPKDAGTK